MRVAVINLGCPKNRVDAEIILGQLAQAGFEITGDSQDAQAVIINTCAFLDEAMEESEEVILAQQKRRRSGELAALLVTGCFPQREPREIMGRFPWVDAFVGIDYIPRIPELLKKGVKKGNVLVSQEPTWNPGREFPRLVSTPPHYSYLRLTEGCSNNCSYCTIPSIRGGLRLRRPEDVAAEARDLVGLDTRELVLIAQDTTAHPELPRIITGLEAIEELRWIRLLYTHPRHLSKEILDQIAGSDKVLNYIDMPVQHLADSVLVRMNRGVGFEKIKRLVEHARMLDPDFAVRTTVITGFPGETDEEFEQLKDRLGELRFTHLGIFMYSAEEGTPAASMPDQVPEELARERALELIDIAEILRKDVIEHLTGTEQEGVVDFEMTEGAVGRLWSDAPEIDRVIEIENEPVSNSPSGFQAGSFGKFIVTGGKDDTLFTRWTEHI